MRACSRGSGRWSRRPSWSANSCLMVMGSEGRGEQILKTDQDNALLLRDGFEHRRARSRHRALQRRAGRVRLPAVPRRHHADQPALAPAAGGFRETLHRVDLRRRPRRRRCIWRSSSTPGGGRRRRAARCRRATTSTASSAGSDAFLARFAARPTSSANRPAGGAGSSASGATTQPLDLKKLGTFPIVHGVRALALQHRVAASTARPSGCALLARSGQLDAGARARPARRAALPDGD